MRPRSVRVQLVPTGRTDLLCIACGDFTTHAGRRREHYAVVAGPGDDAGAVVGLHVDCVPLVRAPLRPRKLAALKRGLAEVAATLEVLDPDRQLSKEEGGAP